MAAYEPVIDWCAQVCQHPAERVGRPDVLPGQACAAGPGPRAAIADHKDFGLGNSLKDKRVMVEYTDPNPFKQFHIGHLMTNIIGASLARIHAAACAAVLRVTYHGDVGCHLAVRV